MKQNELLAEMLGEVWQGRHNALDGKIVKQDGRKALALGSVDFPSLDGEAMKEALGRKWRNHLPALKTLVECYQYITSTKDISIVSISCTAKHLTQIYKSPREVCRVLDAAQRVGLLKCLEETYHFGAFSPYPKEYAYNKQAQAVLKQLFAAYDVEGLPMPQGEEAEAIKADATLEEAYRNSPYKFRFSSKTRMANTSDALALYGLNKTYPQLAEYAAKVAAINANLPPDERIMFQPTITRNAKGDMITKLGIRATNSLVSLPKDGSATDMDPYTRAEMLQAKFGEEWTEVDVKSSVPRVNYLLNHGEWLENGIDLYERMYGKPFESLTMRTQYKYFFMRLYFGSSEKQIAHQLRLTHQTDRFVKAHGRRAAIDTIGMARNGMIAAIGKSYGSEIFLHESCIYIDVFSALIERGYRVIQIYDGFFIKGILSEEEQTEIHSIIKACAEAYYTRHIAPLRALAVDDRAKALRVA
jgi:hypothetical protein